MGRRKLCGSKWRRRTARAHVWAAALIPALALATSCRKEGKTPAQTRPPAKVTVVKVAAHDASVSAEFVGQTQSSRQVEVRARVNAFLEKRQYTEGELVQEGQVMFKLDVKPFQAQLEQAQGTLALEQARLKTAQANLARVKPLVAEGVMTTKDLDDATGAEQTAEGAVTAAQAQVDQAKLNLGYTTIAAPVTGISSYARVQDGAYVSQENNLLTYVVQTDPMWVNFSLSENDMLNYRNQLANGLIRAPEAQAYEVEIVLTDGSVYPERGRLTFADAEYNNQTGTFLVRASVPNPKVALRPGQFVRVRLLGATRPNAILVPQRAVQQGAKGQFVWVVNGDNKVESRPVVVGEWLGDDWFIREGLRPGDQVIVDGGLTVQAGDTVTVELAASAKATASGTPTSTTSWQAVPSTDSATPPASRAGPDGQWRP